MYRTHGEVFPGLYPFAVAYHPDDDAAMIRKAENAKAQLTVDTQLVPTRSVTEVTVYCADHAGLFSKISGALAVAGASIVDARIHTMTNGMALDTFWIQDAAGGTFDAPHRLAQAELQRLRLEGLRNGIHDGCWRLTITETAP